MLLLTRKPNESVIIDFTRLTDAEVALLRQSKARITLVENGRGKVRLGFDVPRFLPVLREELMRKETPNV